MDAPAVAVSNDGKKIAAAWMDMRAGNRDVQWTWNSSGKFGPETTVHDQGANAQGHPSLAIDKDGTLWCAWEDQREGPNQQKVYAAESKMRKNMPVSEGRGAYPTIVSCGGLVAVSYEAGDDVGFRIIAGK